MIFVAVILFIAFFGGMGYAVYWQFNKSDPKKTDTSTQDHLATAQQFLPFQDIKDGMISLGNHKYRAIVECSSTNYNLKTAKEKELIEISFQRFVNSLTFPITFFIQTKVMDNSKMLQSLQDELLEAVNEFEQLEHYGNDYFNQMSNLNAYIGNNKQKKKYIIIPYEEAVTLANLSDAEKYEYSSKELYNRVNMIVDGLSSVGVKAKPLGTKELAELVISTYHKDNYAHVDNVISGEFLTLLTEGESNAIQGVPDDGRLDWILYEAQMRVQNELLIKDLPDFIRENLERTIAELDNMRDQVGGYYKQQSDDYDAEIPLGEEAESDDLTLNLKKKMLIKDVQ